MYVRAAMWGMEGATGVTGWTGVKEGEREDGKEEEGTEKEGDGDMNGRFISHLLLTPLQQERPAVRAPEGKALRHHWHRQHRWCSLQHSTNRVNTVYPVCTVKGLETQVE